MEFVEFGGGEYRLARDSVAARTAYQSRYYRLYSKRVDDFGNVTYGQSWSGSQVTEAGIFAHELFNILSARSEHEQR